jgi:hypothetical protein
LEFFFFFRVFVLSGFANLWGRPKNENKSLGPFNRQEHQNCSTARTGLAPYRLMLRVGGRREAAAITVFLQRKQKRYKALTHRFVVESQLFAGCADRGVSWNVTTAKSKG